MKKIKMGSGFAVFVIFFGIAVIEAIQKQDWLWVSFWIFTGLIFFLADNRKKNVSK